MAKEMGFQKIALASDPFQSRLLRSFSKKYCPGLKAIPVVFDRLQIDDKPMPAIDTTKAFRPDFVSIKERESFWQRLRGTMGKRIKDEVKAEEEANERKIPTAN